MPTHCTPSVEERIIVLESMPAKVLETKVLETFLLSHFDGLTYSEIADYVGMSVTTVHNYMLRVAQAYLVCFLSGAE